MSTKKPTRPQCTVCNTKNAIDHQPVCTSCLLKYAEGLQQCELPKLIQSLEKTKKKLEKDQPTNTYIKTYGEKIAVIQKILDDRTRQVAQPVVRPEIQTIVQQTKHLTPAAIPADRRCVDCGGTMIYDLPRCVKHMEAFVLSVEVGRLPSITTQLLEARETAKGDVLTLINSAIIRCLDRQEPEKKVIQCAPMTISEAETFLDEVSANFIILCDKNIAILEKQLSESKTDEEAEAINREILRHKEFKYKKIRRA